MHVRRTMLATLVAAGLLSFLAAVPMLQRPTPLTTFGIEVHGEGFASGGRSYGVFRTGEACEIEAHRILDEMPASTSVSCLTIRGPGNGDGEVVDRVSFGRGRVVVDHRRT